MLFMFLRFAIISSNFLIRLSAVFVAWECYVRVRQYSSSPILVVHEPFFLVFFRPT